MKQLILCFILLFLVAAKPHDSFTEEDIRKSILELHKSENGKFFIWRECGKRLGVDERDVRAGQYASAIMTSVEDVYIRTGEWIDPRHVKAILFRESSDNECVIGKQEIDRLKLKLGRHPNKREIKSHIKRWFRANAEARQSCRKSKGNSLCVAQYTKDHYSEYENIAGWDIGAAQYRFPSTTLRNRSVILPSGRTIGKVVLSDLLDYEVSIQLLVEDLVEHKKKCRGHKHVLKSRWGHKVRVLDVEEAYFVHHHTYKWSWKYWKHIQKHLKVIDKVKSIALERLAFLFKSFAFRV